MWPESYLRPFLSNLNYLREEILSFAAECFAATVILQGHVNWLHTAGFSLTT